MELEKGSTSDRKGQQPPQIEFVCAKIKFICKSLHWQPVVSLQSSKMMQRLNLLSCGQNC